MSMSSIKMDELLVSWLGSDDVHENVLELIETYRQAAAAQHYQDTVVEQLKQKQQQQQQQQKTGNDDNKDSTAATASTGGGDESINDVPGEENTTEATKGDASSSDDVDSTSSPRGVNVPSVSIPPFYRQATTSPSGKEGSERRRRRRTPLTQYDTWDPLPGHETSTTATSPNNNNDGVHPSLSQALSDTTNNNNLGAFGQPLTVISVRDQVRSIFLEFEKEDDDGSNASPPLATTSSEDSSAPNSPTATNRQPSQSGDADDDDAGTKDNKDGSSPSSPSRLDGAAINMTPPLNHHRSMPADPLAKKSIPPHAFGRITKDICRFPSFFCHPLYHRIIDLWNMEQQQQDVQQDAQQQQQQHPDLAEHTQAQVVTFEMMEWFWKTEMEPYDPCDRFYRLVKQPHVDYICRDDFLPFVKALLQDHPGLEFLSSHAEFQEKYAVTVITRIFYVVNKCHSGRITSRQVRRSDLVDAFHQVDEEEDINKVTRYFSYEHFYVLYCRFWELDHDRDYRITREDLLKYGDHSLSHMIVDRIFDAAPRPFEQERPNRDFLSYEDFIYFMLSEEDKSNEVAVRYWFTCVDVDGDAKLNNMEMRSFYAVQLHRMQCMGHEIVPFEDMLCQMMDMIKPQNSDHLVATDFLQPECCQVSGALFDALFNLNKYLLFEQRDPFVERQKREDEFECDWDRFACIDYNRLAMEEEAREEEAMEIDWVTVDEEDEDNAAAAAAAAQAAAQAGVDGGGGGEFQYQGQGGGGPVVAGGADNAPF